MEDLMGESESPNVQLPPQTSMSTEAGGKSAQPSVGACDACRTRKVRCLANENTMSKKCQRCARAGRECVYTPHSKTRRRKRTDTRVKELEEKVKSLSVLLEQGRAGSVGSTIQPEEEEEEEDMEDDSEDVSEEGDDEGDDTPFDIASAFNSAPTAFDGSVAFADDGKPHQGSIKRGSRDPVSASASITGFQGWRGPIKASLHSNTPDVVDRGLISMDEARKLFDRYINILSPNYPAVVIPADTRAEEMREKRPILFLAVIAAAAGEADPALNLKLNQEILQVYATKVALGGQKSLEIVMSIVLSTLWYYPPDRFEELRFHQFIHMAATMALDIGIGKRPRPPREESMQSFKPSSQNEAHKALGHSSFLFVGQSASSTMEAKRTLLACYLSCASVSMSLRLPNMLRFTSYMADCVNTLETSPDAAATDKKLAAWVRIQRIVEEAVTSFSLDDPGNTASLHEEQTQQMLRAYEMQMNSWRNSLNTPDLNDSFLKINFHVNNIFIHEIALHPDHDPDDFRPPFYIATNPVAKDTRDPSPKYINAIMECVASSKSVIDAFVLTEVTTIRALPALLYVRIVYCCVVLIKLEISSRASSSKIGKLLDSETLEVRSYLDRAFRHLTDVVGTENKNILAAKFLMILKKLVSWYRHQQQKVQWGSNAGQGLYCGPMNKQSEVPNGVASDVPLKKEPQPSYLGAPSMINPPSSTQSYPPLHSNDTLQNHYSNTAPPPSIPGNFTSAHCLNFNRDRTPSDMSSPDYTNPSGSTLPYDANVSMDMFGHLQDAQPWQFEPIGDANIGTEGWMFAGMDYGNMPDFDWGPV